MQIQATTAIRCSECAPWGFVVRCDPRDHEAIHAATWRHNKEHGHRGARYDSLDPPYWRGY